MAGGLHLAIVSAVAFPVAQATAAARISAGAMPVIRVRKPARAAFVDKRRRWTSHLNSTAPDGEVKRKGSRELG